MEDPYSSQATVDRALVALAYYEALGKPGSEQVKLLESEYNPKYLAGSMMALVGMMLNLFGAGIGALPGNEDLSADEIEALTIKHLREQLVAMGRFIN